jgi:hypothetical protein
MENLSNWIILEIFSFLTFKDLASSCFTVSKRYHSLIKADSIWKSRFANRKPTTFYSDPYFEFPDSSSLIDSLCLANIFPQDFSSLKSYLQAIQHPMPVISNGVKASSTHLYNEIHGTLVYDDAEIWSSEPTDDENTDEFLIYELTETSYVFSVHFKANQAMWQGGEIYPPKKVKVWIGETAETFTFESEEFEVPVSEAYNTVLILPNFVKGKFIKLELIGKVTKEPTSGQFLTLISFVDVIGYPLEPIENKILSLIESKDIKKILKNIDKMNTPFWFERLNKFGLIKEIFEPDMSPQYDINEYFNYIINLQFQSFC